MRVWSRVSLVAMTVLFGGCSSCIVNDPKSLKCRDADSEDVILEELSPEPEEDGTEESLDLPEEDDLDAPEEDAEDAPDLDIVVDPVIEYTVFVTIRVEPSTSFTMGAPTDELGYDDDQVQHEVTLTHDFEIMENEVRQDEFEAIMGYNPAYWSGVSRTRFPVDSVTWDMAADFANQFTLHEGISSTCYDCRDSGTLDVYCELKTLVFATPYACPGYRLPAEAEWEYSARGGTTTATYNGDLTSEHGGCSMPNLILQPIAWFCGNSGFDMTYGKRKNPNVWGLFDMLGNAQEWVQDWYADYPGDVTDPWGPSDGLLKVVRGGSFSHGSEMARAAFRNTYLPTDCSETLGFRLVRTLP